MNVCSNDIQQTSVVEHLNDIVDRMEFILRNVEPVIESERQFDPNLFALNLQEIGERLQ